MFKTPGWEMMIVWYFFLGGIAGGAYFTELASTTPSAANVKAYADILREASLRRGMIDAGTQIVDQPARALRRIDISGKQDKPQRIGVAEESAFVGREVGPSAAQDRRARAAHE